MEITLLTSGLRMVEQLVEWIAPATAGTYAITCTVSDGKLIDIQVISITVTEPEPENHSPVITSTAITSAIVGEAYAYDVDATDPDEGDVLTYSLLAAPTGMAINSSTGLINWVPTAAGSFGVTVEVSDGELSDTQTFIITVLAEESDEDKIKSVIRKFLQALSDQHWNEARTCCVYGSTLYDGIDDQEGLYDDEDIVDINYNENILEIIINDEYAEVNLNMNAELILSNSGVYQDSVECWLYLQKIDSSWKLYDSFFDDYFFDDPGLINQSPVITSTAVTSATVGETYIYDVDATDPDEGDILTYSLNAGPAGMTIEVHTGEINWTPTAVGSYYITVEVSDGELTDTQTFIITVLEPETENYSPVISSLSANPQSPIEINQNTVITCSASDPDGDPLAYTWTKTGGIITGAGSTITWIAPATAGTYTITCTVSDGELSDTQSFIITVISSEVKAFLGEWVAIMPTRISSIIIQIEDNQFLISVWMAGQSYNDQPLYYYWGEQIVEISDFSDGTLELNWTTYSEWSCNQKIMLLANGVLKIFSTEHNYAGDYSLTYTDYFYNPEAINSYIPSLLGSGLYQDDSEFVDIVNALDGPKKICQYMENNINYKALSGPHSPYQTYLSKEGDCADYAVFASAIANFHGYECFIIIMYWTSNACHAITVYNMGNYYTYSSNYLYFDQNFDSIEECVNHCASTYIGFIEGTLSSYEVYNWDYYNYRNVNSR